MITVSFLLCLLVGDQLDVVLFITNPAMFRRKPISAIPPEIISARAESLLMTKSIIEAAIITGKIVY